MNVTGMELLINGGTSIEEMIKDAVMKERKECAKACDRQAQLQIETGADYCCVSQAKRCARDIRMRGKEVK